MTDSRQLRLTDELERQLMRRAIEEQFRPRPLLALGRLLKKALRRPLRSGRLASTGIGNAPAVRARRNVAA